MIFFFRIDGFPYTWTINMGENSNDYGDDDDDDDDDDVDYHGTSP